MAKIYVRPSFITKFDECPFAADLQYNKKICSEGSSANLVFGTAVHDAIGKWVLADSTGLKFDPVAQFEMNWDEATTKQVVRYNSQMGPDDLLETGKRLCDLFPQAWRDAGLVPLVDEQGLVIERKLEVEILPGVILTGTPDVVAMDEDGEVVVIDFKTPASASPELFYAVSDQLTAYQILVEGNPSLGVPSVARVGFMELLKKKVPKTSRGEGPKILAPACGSRRTPEQIAAFTQKVAWIVEDMRNGRYPKRPRMAFNTPCSMCDFKGFCHEGETEGLIFPSNATDAA
jgi:hypothetical protein